MNTLGRIVLVVPAALLLAACSSTEPIAMHRVSLSAAVASAGVRPTSGISADLIIGDASGSVSISSAQMVLSRLKLANNDPCADNGDDDVNDADDANENDANETPDDETEEPDDPEDDDGDEDSGCAPLNVGPVSVDLPLDGTTKVFLDALVPAGTYTRLQAKLHPVDANDAGASDFLTAHPDLAGISVKVVGTFKDAGGTNHAFTFTSNMNVVSAINFDPPVTVDAGTTNLTIDVDVGSWFTDASGAVIDPTNSANQHTIEKNIRASLRAFEDDDHDGDDDSEEGTP